MLKKVVVYTNVKDPSGTETTMHEEFTAKKDWLTVHNNDEGMLIVNDVPATIDAENRVENLAVFNSHEWKYWKTLQ